jgi:hypothetical protein
MKVTRKISVIFLTVGCALSQATKPPATGTPLGLKDTRITVRLLSAINNKTSQKGDRFSAEVIAPESLQGAALEGDVESVKRARGSDKAEISLLFTTIAVGDVSHPIRATLKDVSNSRGLKDVDEAGRAIANSMIKVEAATIGVAVGGALGDVVGGRERAAMYGGASAVDRLIFATTLTTTGNGVEFAPGSQFVLDVSDQTQR